MEALQQQIEKELKQFKAAFIEKTVEWAAIEFERLSAVTEQDIIDGRGYRDYSFKSKYPDGVMRHTKASFAYWGKIYNIQYKGKDSFVSNMKANAELHFEASISRVVSVAEKKGLDVSISRVVDVRFEAGNLGFIVTDGNKRITAQTIVAWGEIQRPHYRYIIK